MKIGFTVGVWDLLHEGHTNLLKEAKEHCDYLIVGIMTDFWVRVQKDHDRPFQSFEKRLAELRGCELCDKIVILDTLDMHPYLQMVDVWIKGIDQKNMRPNQWPNEIFLSRTPDISTTDLIKRVRKLDKDEV
jgi:glycerol-3-phosphate cytidylyltransferase